MPEEVMAVIPDLAVTPEAHRLQLEVVLTLEEVLQREEALALALLADLHLATEEEVINKTYIFYEKAIFHSNGPCGHYFFSSSRYYRCP